MVKKFYAKLTQSANGDPNVGETVDAFQALKLVDSAEILTKPKEKGTLFDIETGLKVRPFTGRKTKNDRGLPYFGFYPNEDSPLKGLANSAEWSDELKLFIRAFEHISKFQIEEYDEPSVYIFPANMRKLVTVNAESSSYVLKFLVEIGETRPYSSAYLYNCRLGIELTVTSKPTPIKRKELAEIGIPVFLANARIPKYIQLPDTIDTDQQFSAIAREIQNTYEHRNYRLQGRFVNVIKTLPENLEKYTTLKNYEDQIRELTGKIAELQRECSAEEEALRLRSSQLEKQRQATAVEKERWKAYRQHIDHYDQLERRNDELNNTVEKLTDKYKQLESSKDIFEKSKRHLEQSNTRLEQSNNRQAAKIQQLTEELEKSKRSWLSRLLGK